MEEREERGCRNDVFRKVGDEKKWLEKRFVRWGKLGWRGSVREEGESKRERGFYNLLNMQVTLNSLNH